MCWVGAVTVGLLLVIWQIVWGGPAHQPADRAQVWGTLLATVAVLPPTVAWTWTRLRRGEEGPSSIEQVSAAAGMLASKLFSTWSEQLGVRGIQTPSPVRVRWRWADDDLGLSRHHLTNSEPAPTGPSPLPRSVAPSDDGEILNSGLVTRLYEEVYARLSHGRLALIGGPGAGKTAAMMLLLVEALRQRSLLDEQESANAPVPIWLTMGWHPEQQDVRSWLTTSLVRDHPYLRAATFGPNAAERLFDTGRLALFLDGLDEMPAARRVAAIRRLANETAGLRVVMTSRPDEYRSTIEDSEPLPLTAVLELRPVDARTAAHYLLDGRFGRMRLGLGKIVDRMQSQPTGALARTLNTPLTLSLTRAAYANEDPRPLLALELSDQEIITQHLLDQVLLSPPTPIPASALMSDIGWAGLRTTLHRASRRHPRPGLVADTNLARPMASQDRARDPRWDSGRYSVRPRRLSRCPHARG